MVHHVMISPGHGNAFPHHATAAPSVCAVCHHAGVKLLTIDTHRADAYQQLQFAVVAVMSFSSFTAGWLDTRICIDSCSSAAISGHGFSAAVNGFCRRLKAIRPLLFTTMMPSAAVVPVCMDSYSQAGTPCR
jgi:hypothetical protein